MKQELQDMSTKNNKDIQDQLDQMQIENKQLQKHMNESVGFSAKLLGDRYISSGEVVSFNHVISNFGGHYSNETYTFTCPVHGVYMFSMTMTEHDQTHVRGILYRNDDALIRSTADNGGDFDSASATVVTECNAGDQVYVTADLEGIFDGDRSPSHFTGYLVHHYL